MKNNSKLDTKLTEYDVKFNDCFPLYAMRNAEEDEIINVIDACLESGKPYAPQYDDNADY
ncbi:MAG: hypothetical protein RSE04_05970 [Hydrogenoanaerobacterium sp.]